MKKLTQTTIILALISLVFVQNIYSRELTLDSAISIALVNNNDIRIANLELDKANASVKEAYGYAYPSVDFSTQFSHFVEKPKMPFPDFGAMLNNAVYGVLFKENVVVEDKSKFLPMETVLQSFALANSYSTTLSMQQVLFSSTVFKGIGSSGIYQQIARESLVSKISNTVANVKKAFYGALLSRDALEITKQSFKNAQDNLASVKAIQKQGMVADYDAMKAEVQVENIRPVVMQMETNYEMVLNNLKVLLGMSQSEEINLTGTINYNVASLSDDNTLLDQVKTNNPDIKTLNRKRDFDEALIQLDISQYYPTIAAFGQYSLSGSSDDFDFQNYSQAVVGLNFSINLFNGFRTTHRMEQSKINVLKTDESIAMAINAMQAQLKTKITEIKKIQSNIEAQERNVTLAQKTYEIAQLRYKNGTGNQLEVENADMALYQAKINKLQSVYQYITLLIDIDQLTGNIDKKYLKIKIY
jgi:outer membrane protein TolC